MRRGRPSVLAGLAVVAAVALPGAGAPSSVGAAPTPDDCGGVVSTSTVRRALGVRAAAFAGPESFGPGRCGWHSTDPSCGPRTLGIEVITAADASAGVDPVPGDGVIVVAVDGVGDEAFFATHIDELGSAAQFERLHVRADGVWRRFTVLGRPGEHGRRVLVEVAHEVLASA